MLSYLNNNNKNDLSLNMADAAPGLETKLYFRSKPSRADLGEERPDTQRQAPLQALPPFSKMAQAEGAGYRPLATSRLELNLVRLLCRCESMAAEKREPNEWRLEKVRDFHAPAEASNPRDMSRLTGHAPSGWCCTSSAAPPLGAQVLDAQVALPDLIPSCTCHSLSVHVMAICPSPGP